MNVQKNETDHLEIGHRTSAANSAPAAPDFLCQLLAAREERALVQKNILSSSSGGCLVQITVNVPGCPKRIENDEAVVQIAEAFFLRGANVRETVRVSLVNGAGVALLLFFPSLDPIAAKKTGIDVESTPLWGRALDIDVIARNGILTRKDVSLPARRCILCENEAKICARERRHDIGELRDAVRRMLTCAQVEI